jgi:hypothetical protein
VVPETGVWIIGDGESLPFRKVFTSAPGPKHITKDKGGVTNEKEDQEGNPGSVSRRTVATAAECQYKRTELGEVREGLPGSTLERGMCVEKRRLRLSLSVRHSAR